MGTTLNFASSEQLLDLYAALSVQLDRLGEDILSTDDFILNRAKKLLWESGFSLQQGLRHELLSVLLEKQTVPHTCRISCLQ